ncbi:MAG: hypothetical protein WA919_09105 [Coleofasciculaceae cyanobacterium]
MIPTDLSPKDQVVAIALEEQGFTYTHKYQNSDSEPDWANSIIEEFQGWEIQSQPTFKITHIRSGHIWQVALEDAPRNVSQVKMTIHRAIADNFDDLMEY